MITINNDLIIEHPTLVNVVSGMKNTKIDLVRETLKEMGHNVIEYTWDNVHPVDLINGLPKYLKNIKEQTFLFTNNNDVFKMLIDHYIGERIYDIEVKESELLKEDLMTFYNVGIRRLTKCDNIWRSSSRLLYGLLFMHELTLERA